MVIIITGASCVGKTHLSQKLLEEIKYTYLSADHLKMGLIRSKVTNLRPEDDFELTKYLWNIEKEIIMTAIENKQNLIIEGCYIPFDYRKYFDKEYLKDILFIGLSLSKNYINKYYDDIIKYSNIIENRIFDINYSKEEIIKDNEYYYNGFTSFDEKMNVIEDNYSSSIDEIVASVCDYVKRNI